MRELQTGILLLQYDVFRNNFTTTQEANNNNKNILSFICWKVRFRAMNFQKIKNTIDIALWRQHINDGGWQRRIE